MTLDAIRMVMWRCGILCVLAAAAMAQGKAVAPAPALLQGDEARAYWAARMAVDYVRNSPNVSYREVVKYYSHDFAVLTELPDKSAGISEGVVDRAKFALLLWPTNPGPGAHGFLMHADGTEMICDVQPGDGWHLDHAFAKGGGAGMADLLRQPGADRRGAIWLWSSQRHVSCRVEVVDPEGRARADISVSFGSVMGAHVVPLDGVLPLGAATAGADGGLTVRGLPCDRVVALFKATNEVGVLGRRVLVERLADRIRFVVPGNAMTTAAALRNDSAAMATLKNISSAQAQCQASAVIDANGNGAGEYGFFAELAGAVGVRNDAKGGIGDAKINPPVLSNAFRKVQNGRVQRSGFLFQIYLVGPDGKPVAEADGGGSKGVHIDPARAEVIWCCYAWPADATSGSLTLFINQAGDVLSADAEYVGPDKAPKPDAAFAGDGEGKIDGATAVNAKGRDGHFWVVRS